ncbi:hypothetical protein [Aestuariispira insulae]|uniref:Lipoprotein n=1 Tax=Aestuariispira insulae TaxID=1461337 RepID=A0A3D9H7B7_9PROT|nr:hypothetical protein [Aestuariispira insulae]RED45051.1 hypothetical protein DFP90_11244 [Aestuariispira insulae]
MNNLRRLFYPTLACYRLLLIVAVLAPLSACEEDTPTATEKALIRLELTDFQYQQTDDRDRYYHRRRFTALNGTGARVTKGRVCVENGAVCAEAVVDYRIEGDSVFEQPQSFFATRAETDRITVEYWLIDDAGFEHHLTAEIQVADQQAKWVEQ